MNDTTSFTINQSFITTFIISTILKCVNTIIHYFYLFFQCYQYVKSQTQKSTHESTILWNYIIVNPVYTRYNLYSMFVYIQCLYIYSMFVYIQCLYIFNVCIYSMLTISSTHNVTNFRVTSARELELLAS